MCDQHKPISPSSSGRHGSALEHGQAHTQDHERWSRRHFLRTLGAAGSASFLLGNFPVTALAASPLAYALANGASDNILVLIRQKGGNDSLNMIVPVFDYGTYQTYRPNIAIPQNQLLALNTSFAMPRTMEPLDRLWRDGSMHVVNSVGYPDQNLSHFRSADIWASASDSNETLDSGWLGRWLDGEFPEFAENPPVDPPAIQIGGAGNLMFTNEEGIDMALIVNNPEELEEIARNGFLYDVNAVPECYYGEQLSYLRSVANSTFRYAKVIAEAFKQGANSVEYKRPNPLAEQLALVARLIKGGMGTRLYMVELDGFDTHARQDEIHPILMRYLAEAVRSFYDDLAVGGYQHRVLATTVSEFGRRPKQNASRGTDHGAGASLLLFGPGLGSNGFSGPSPELRNLDADENLRFGIDFRQIYATLLEGWLCIDGATVDAVLGGRFERLPSLGLRCSATSVGRPVAAEPLRHWNFYQEGRMVIRYDLPEAAQVHIQVFNILGQPIATLENSRLPAGEHQVVFQPPMGFAGGHYVYSIRAGNRRVSEKMVFAR